MASPTPSRTGRAALPTVPPRSPRKAPAAPPSGTGTGRAPPCHTEVFPTMFRGAPILPRRNEEERIGPGREPHTPCVAGGGTGNHGRGTDQEPPAPARASRQRVVTATLSAAHPRGRRGHGQPRARNRPGAPRTGKGVTVPEVPCRRRVSDGPNGPPQRKTHRPSRDGGCVPHGTVGPTFTATGDEPGSAVRLHPFSRGKPSLRARAGRWRPLRCRRLRGRSPSAPGSRRSGRLPRTAP